MNKQRILLSAIACDPKNGSEPFVGWNFAMMLADDYDVHVLTREYSRPLIDGHPDANKLTFHFADFFGLECQEHNWRYMKGYYLLWEFLVLFKFVGLQARYSFRVVHQVTYNTIDVPGFLWLIPGPRFIWGPVGAGQVPPRSLNAVLGHHRWKDRFRRLVKSVTRYNPVIRGAIWRASIVLLANQETADRLAGLRFRSAMMRELATSVDPDREPPIGDRHDNRIRFLWIGRIIPYKGLTLALDGFRCALDKDAGRTDMELVVIGVGDDMARCKEHARRVGVSDRVIFAGAIPHSEIDGRFAESDAFVFTSVCDTTGTVLLEAMRNARPTIALNHQGAKAMITQGGARLVDIGDYDETADRLGAAMVELARDPDLRLRMGRLALEEVRARHTWAPKRKQLLDIYADVLCEEESIDAVSRRSEQVNLVGQDWRRSN